MVRQGVTTIITGNCGHSPFPVGLGGAEALRAHSAFLARDLEWQWSTAKEYLAWLDELPLAVNVGVLAGLGAVQVAVMGLEARC